LGTNFVNNIGSMVPLLQGLIGTNGEVYVTGFFQSVGTTSATNIAKWDGNQWTALGAGVNPPAFSSSLDVALMGTNVLVGTLRNLGTNWILSWNGSSWSTFPGIFTRSDGSSVWLLKILVMSNQLYVGGRFSHVDGIEANGLAHWDGNQWRGFGSGIGGVVFDLSLKDGKIYAVGDFTRAGTKGSGRFAIWSAAAPSALSLGVVGSTLRLTWPEELTNILQSTPNISAPNWQAVSDPPTTTNGQKALNIFPTNSSRFFRLN
jgi:hypothetical protein